MMKFNKSTMAAVVLIMGVSVIPSIAYSDGKHSYEMEGKTTESDQQHLSLEAQKIKQILIAYSKAIGKGDIEKMGSFLTGETFSVVEGKHANWGWQDYRDNHLTPEFNSSKFKLLEYNISDIRVGEGHMLSYAVFDFELVYEWEGERKNKKGMGTAIFENKKGEWFIRHIHTS
ncbi:nuclear transport factor 2 family protein [Paremcibacter congregatus]|uniref:nuclear transport factor 2 family protein n=1 Tax=Paremcibacter congregatus TaxID=2043170 RepID=UPI0030ED39DC|tara:strand:- start:4793 stop:5311 length:519 start_codon:yes stop_codon:yes gene_type:complete